MDEQRHPHPHLDPRQPRNGAKPSTNPPVFAWKPIAADGGVALTVTRDTAFSDVCLQADGLTDLLFLPEAAFAPGRYFWKWTAGAQGSEVFSFEITADAVTLEVPGAAEWLRRFPATHPRVYLRPEELPELRASRSEQRSQLWQELRAAAEHLLAEPHELAEPPFLPDWSAD